MLLKKVNLKIKMEFETQYYGNIFKLILDRNTSYNREYIKYFSGNCDHFMRKYFV